MNKFKVEKVILRDEGKIQLTCSCCGRPSEFDLREAVTFLKEKYEPRWLCQFEDCELDGSKIDYQKEEVKTNYLSDTQIRQILGFILPNV